MGADMWDGGERNLYTKDECFLVSEWCSVHDNRESTIDDIGRFDYSSDVVKKADGTTPLEFHSDSTADKKITEDIWQSARKFLKETAEAGHGISGSY